MNKMTKTLTDPIQKSQIYFTKVVKNHSRYILFFLIGFSLNRKFQDFTVMLLPSRHHAERHPPVVAYKRAYGQMQSGKCIQILTEGNQKAIHFKSLRRKIANQSMIDLGGISTIELLVFLAASRPKRIHVIDSYQGWKILELTFIPKFISKQWVISIYSEGHSADQKIGYFWKLDSVYSKLSVILTDNHKIIEKAQGLFGRSVSSIMRFVPTPISERKIVLASIPPRIMWASRIDIDKGFDKVVEICIEESDLEILVFGKIESQYQFPKSLPTNLRYFGPFEDFYEIVQTYKANIFLFTSRVEGTPNVLLEAIASGMVVISTDVGDVSRLIGKDSNNLIPLTASTHEFVARILEVIDDCGSELSKAQYIKQQMLVQHSWEKFYDSFSLALQSKL